MLNLRSRPSSSIRSLALRAGAAAALIGVAALGSACSGSPSAPGSVLSAGRRVQTGSGGGTLGPCVLCEPISGRIEIVSVRGTLNGPTDGWETKSESRPFELTSTLKGEGTFESGFIKFSVEGETATIALLQLTSNGQIFENTNVKVPATVTEVADASCTTRSGTLVVTTITTPLENLGRTTITERHCAAE
jgi:hypothetical protein